MLARWLIGVGLLMALPQLVVERPWQLLFLLGLAITMSGAAIAVDERTEEARDAEEDLREADWHAEMDELDRAQEKAGVAWWLS